MELSLKEIKKETLLRRFFFSPRSVIIAEIGLMMINGFGVMYGWFLLFPYLDIPLHLWGGFLVGMFFFAGVGLKKTAISTKKRQNSFMISILSLGFVALVGIGWEIFEYVIDLYVNAPRGLFLYQRGIFDTLKDLFLDLLGGMLAVILYLASERRRVKEI